LLIPLILYVSEAVAGSGPVDIHAANAYLARTLNIAFTFDAPKEGAWGHTLQYHDFKTIKDAGFTAVRLPIQWVTRMNAAPPFTIDPAFLSRIDSVIQWALDNHLAIILDNHLDEQLMKDPATYRGRFLSLWTQLSEHYKGAPQQVMFEVMAEPHAKLDSAWNQYFSDALSIIRQTNSTRPVIVGPRLYNMPFTLGSLQLPQDDYLILTFHYYNPVKFTMQGEEWFPMGNPKEWIGTSWTGTDQEKMDINHAMDLVADWAKKNNRPVFLGEFGAGDHADSLSRARYFGYIRQQAEAHGFSWGFFNFSVKFSLYDQTSQAWHEGLLHALIPGIPN
jgi:endoglucanase